MFYAVFNPKVMTKNFCFISSMVTPLFLKNFLFPQNYFNLSMMQKMQIFSMEARGSCLLKGIDLKKKINRRPQNLINSGHRSFDQKTSFDLEDKIYPS